MSDAFARDRCLLAFDTSGPVGSVAVAVGFRLASGVSLGGPGQHASRLVPSIEEALSAAGVPLESVSGILVGEGPGSFTGVRVAAATAKGLSAALGVPVWGLSSLAGAALTVDAGPFRYVLFDAREDRVYGACYGVGRAGLTTVAEPHAGVLREALDGDVPPGTVFLGDGATRHRLAIEAAGFAVLDPLPEGLPIAQGLLRCLELESDMPPIPDLASWEPRYLREPSLGRPWTR